MRLASRTQSSGPLFAPTQDTSRIDALVDRINAKFGYNKLYFGSMRLALEHDTAPMRNRVSDTDSENEASHNPLGLQTMDRFNAIAESEHRRRERGGKILRRN
jgi:DNA polymerase IV